MDKNDPRSRQNSNKPRSETTPPNGADNDTPGTTTGGTSAFGGSNSNHANGDSFDARENGRGTPRSLPETFLDERDDVLGVINELEDQLDRYEQIRETLERDLGEANEQLQATKARVQELEWQTVALQARVDAADQVRQEVTLLEEEIADSTQRNQRLTEQLSQSEKEAAHLAGELKSAGKQLEELWTIRKERDGLRNDAKILRGKLEATERAQRELADERATLLARVQETQIALDETRAQRNQLELELRAGEERTQEARRLQETLEQKIEELRGERKTHQAQLTKLERENSRLLEQQQFFECELTSLRSLNRNTESALSSVKKAFAEVRVALSETKSRARRRTIDSWPRGLGGIRGNDLARTGRDALGEIGADSLEPASTEASD